MKASLSSTCTGDAPSASTAAVTVTHVAEATTDAVRETFGVRTIAWSASGGFRLNGAALKLRGGCVHHANGPLGSAAVDRADERRVELLKAAGYNAIRTSHNPPSPAFLDACDRLGVVVMDESFDCWDAGKRPNDYNLWFKQWGERDIAAILDRVQADDVGDAASLLADAQALNLAALPDRISRARTPASCEPYG